MKEKFLILGLGQCGGNIAEEYYKNGYDTAAINTADSDLDQLSMSEKLIVGKTEGSGQNHKLATQTFEENKEKVKEFVVKLAKYKETVLVFFATSGGTGRGFFEPAAKMLRALNKKVLLLPVSPFDFENGIALINDYTAYILLEEMKNDFPILPIKNTQSKVSMNKTAFMLFDNLVNGEYQDAVLDYRDLINGIREGYNLIAIGSGKKINLTIDKLDTSNSKTAILINSKNSDDFNYSDLEKINLGIFDRKIYKSSKEDNLFTILLGGLNLHKETIDKLKNVVVDSVAGFKERAKKVEMEGIEDIF